MSKPLAALAALLALAPALPLRADDWPQWRGPNRDGLSAEKNWKRTWPAGGPTRLWERNVGISCSSLAVVGDRVYTIGNADDTDTVYALDAATGAIIWKHSYPCPLDPHQFEGGSGATPSVDGDRVYTVSRAGHLRCLNRADGKAVWIKHLEKDLGGKAPTWGYSGSALVLDQLVILDVGAPGGSTVALDKQTGATVWRSGDDGAGYATVAPFTHGGRTLLACFNAFGLVIRDAAQGREIARHAWKTSYDVNSATPIIDGDRIFISSGYNKGAALLRFTGSALQPVWENRKMRNHFNSSVLWQGHLYGFDESALACVAFATGEQKWKQDGLGKGSLMIADGQLIVLGERGDLVIAEATPAGFQESARAKVLKDRCWVVPVLAGGRIYVKNNVGQVACLDVSGR